MEIRVLQPSDDRTPFCSGDELLDRFFRTYAGQNQFRHHIGVTYVAVEAELVVAFATVAPSQIEIENLPPNMRKRLPQYPLPVLRLARLAVDQKVRAQGLGRQLLAYVCRLAQKMSDELGCVGVVVDAKPGAIEFYQRYGFVAFDVVEGESSVRPRPQPMFLSMRAIQKAMEKEKDR